MEQIRQRRAVARRKFSAHARSLENTVLNDSYPDEYLTENDLRALSKFDELWWELADIEEEFLESGSEADDSSEQYHSRYSELLPKVRRAQRVVKTSSSTCSETSRTPTRDPFADFHIGTNPNPSHLPTLPKFSGEPDEWEKWWNRFNRKIWSNDQYNTADQVDSLHDLLPQKDRNRLPQFNSLNPDKEEIEKSLRSIYSHPLLRERQLFQKLNKLPDLTEVPSSKLLEAFHAFAQEVVQSTAQLDLTTLDKLYRGIRQKLPALWRRQVIASNIKDISHLAKFIMDQLFAAREDENSELAINQRTRPFRESNYRHRSNTSSVNFTTTSHSIRCIFCSGPHLNRDCHLPNRRRKEIITSKRLCLACFRRQHNDQCGHKCNQCGQSHNALICTNTGQSSSNVTSNSQITIPKTSNTVNQLATMTAQRNQSYLAIAKVLVNTGSEVIPANCLIDSGADISLMSKDFHNRTRLPLQQLLKQKVSGFGESHFVLRHQVWITLENSERTHRVNDYLMIGPRNLVSELMPIPLHVAKIAEEKGIPTISPVGDEPVKIDILFGADWIDQHLRKSADRQRHVDLIDCFEAMDTNLGYVIHGTDCMPSNLNREDLTHHLNCLCTDLKKLFKEQAESVTDEDRTWDQTYKNEIQYDATTKRMIAPLPWISNERPSTNYHVVARKSHILRERLIKNDTYKSYTETINTLLANENIEEVVGKEKYLGHFLPHHPVIKPNSTTPIRPVFNASFSIGDRKSLNDHLFKGNTDGFNLNSMLIQWRVNPVAIFADIKRAFLQIRVPESDRKYVRFIWFKEEIITTYQFTSVLFGASPSPYILKAVIEKLFSNEENPPKIYMDDLLFATNSINAVVSQISISQNILEKASFELHKIAAPKRLVEKLSPTLPDMDFKTESSTTVLGLTWQLENDLVMFRQPEIEIPDKWTRRTTARAFASIYDPLGLLLPFVVMCRSVMRDCFDEATSWDEPLSSETESKVNALVVQVKLLPKINIKRLLCAELAEAKLIIFADASKTMFGACAYLYCRGERNLIMARARLAPAKERTIPQLELCAALEAALLHQTILDILPSLEPGILHTDSMTTLGRINGHPNNLAPFEAHRVLKIQSLTDKIQWKYVATKQNPADILSRGCTLSKLAKNELWWHGPIIPEEEMICCPKPHLVALVRSERGDHPPETYTRLLSIEFNKALRTMELIFEAFERRFHYSSRTRPNPLKAIFKIIQEIYLKRERRALSDGNRVREGPYKTLPLILDEDELVRVKRRLDRSALSYDQKFPILLPNCPIVKSMIKTRHSQMFHAGITRLVLEINTVLFIPKLNRTVRSIVHSCLVCNRFRGTPFVPPTISLPSDRAQSSRPFSVIGVDLFELKSKNINKRVMIFACSVIRAIHLEIVGSKNVESVINAIRRFAAMYGWPEKIYSDNEKSFKKASNLLKQISGRTYVGGPLINIGSVTWQFNPPMSPWYGGFYERCIGTVKNAIKPFEFQGKKCSMDDLRTILSEVENFVNNRPLLAVEGNIALTPNHFIFGRGGVWPGNRDSSPTPADLKAMYDRISRRVNGLWKKWTVYYLTSLRRYWQEQSRTPRIGELVLIKKNNVPRGEWPMATIEGFTEDRGKHVVDLRTAEGKVIQRAVQGIVPLELRASSPPPGDVSRNAI